MEAQVVFNLVNDKLVDVQYSGLDNTQYVKALEAIAAYIKQRQQYVDQY